MMRLRSVFVCICLGSMLAVGWPGSLAVAEGTGERFHVDLMCVIAHRTSGSATQTEDDAKLQDGIGLELNTDTGKMLAHLARAFPGYRYTSPGFAHTTCVDSQSCELKIARRPGDAYSVSVSESVKIARTDSAQLRIDAKGSLSFVSPETGISYPVSWDGYRTGVQIGKTYAGSISRLVDGTRIFCLCRISLDSLGSRP